MLTLILISVALFIVSGFMSFSFHNKSAILKNAAPLCIAAGATAILVFLFSNFRLFNETMAMHFSGWQLPFADFSMGLDSLSAFFLIPLSILALSCSLYGPRYFAKHGADRMHWLFYSLLICGMIMVLIARNAVLFIIAWEIMSLSSFFLVITDKKNPESITAGWIYFVTAHIGTAFLFGLFFLISSIAGSTDFSAWKGAALLARQQDAVFILAVVAFGLKAGFIPFHVWLPLAHPAAPSHVSGLMSGIMIKMGIYGILRMLSLTPSFHLWWGILLIAVGAISGVLGVLFAIGQHDIKRLLAYHSVENIGIILLGIGLGIVGVTYNCPTIALFGFAGGLLHIVNHSLFKALLFLGAGAVISRTGTGEIDRLGGLIRSMPKTGIFFLIGAAAICGLPFFNGFISEVMIYAGSIRGAILPSKPVLSMLCLIVVLSLAVIGGLAAACFTKVFGIVFLGEPRTESAKASGDVPASMLWGMGILAVFCFVIGLCSPLVYPFLAKPASMLALTASSAVDSTPLLSFTSTLSIVLGLCALLTAIVVIVKKMIEKKKHLAVTVTWDCGYSSPDPSMQYTASSFAAPIINYFKTSLAARQNLSKGDGFFPVRAWKFHSAIDDWFLSKVFLPIFQWCDRLFASMRWFQNGKSGQYVLYIAIALFGLIIWKFFL